ncbi:MAG: hypothetical protein FWB90_08875 [Fibromonadales bacterium]|nr:hypothetical protein [Fibromonadales bacterium]
MAKQQSPTVDEKMLDQYNAEAIFRSEAYWDSIQESNPIVQGFRYIMKNYEISIEKQEKLGKQGEGYHLCIRKKKQARPDL